MADENEGLQEEDYERLLNAIELEEAKRLAEARRTLQAVR